jgi:aspartate/methionine/tyrosine aminotransferase
MMGISLAMTHIEQIGEWQERTKSNVLVDGTFQYLKWNDVVRENSSLLNKEYTFRIVCPTKSLVIHGVRFSYMLLPAGKREDIDYSCENISGSDGIFNLAGARQIMRRLNMEESNKKLRRYIAGRRGDLQGWVFGQTLGEPSCSYYVFAKPLINKESCITMGQDFFDLAGFDEYVRFNLLTPPDVLEEIATGSPIKPG